MLFEATSSPLVNTANTAIDPYPTTQSGWVARYGALRRAYLMGEYGRGEMELRKLFRALDDNGNEIDWTRRLFGTGAFLVDTDARALTGGRLILERPRKGGASAAGLAAGESVWRRSEMPLQVAMAARMTACLGDYWIEAIRTRSAAPYDTVLVCYDPEMVEPEYDTAVPSRLIRATVTSTDPNGKQMVRVIDAESIRVTVDGTETTGSGKHGAGVVPLAHLRWAPFGDFSHSLGAMAGLDNTLARIDSIVCQLSAGLTRFGNPTIVVSGARVGNTDDVGRFGRIWHGLPEGARVEYLQLAAGTIQGGLDVIRELLAHIRETRPEFLFANSGAGESGTARGYLAAAFNAAIYEVRGHWFDAVQRITGIAVAMDQARAYDADADALTIDAPPPLPVDVKTQIEALYMARDDIRRADRVRSLQALGMVDPTVDPEAYAVQVEDEQAASAATMLTPMDTGADTPTE